MTSIWKGRSVKETLWRSKIEQIIQISSGSTGLCPQKVRILICLNIVTFSTSTKVERVLEEEKKLKETQKKSKLSEKVFWMLDTWKWIVLFYLILIYRSQYRVSVINHINEKDVRTRSHLQETEKDLLTCSHKLSSSSGWFSGFILPENFSTSVHCYFWNWLLHSSPCFYYVFFPSLSFLLKTWVLESMHRFQNTKN